MSDTPLNEILWMAEELDFQIPPENQNEAKQLINIFLESAANTGISHSVYPA